MWKGKLLIKTPKNITNKCFYYLYFILYSLHNMSKDVYPKIQLERRMFILLRVTPVNPHTTDHYSATAQPQIGNAYHLAFTQLI